MRSIICFASACALSLLPSVSLAQSPAELRDPPTVGDLPAAGGFWNRLGPSAQEQPEARLSATVIYDPIGKRLILFGGWDVLNLDDTWSLSLADPSQGWHRLTTAGAPPSARLEHTAIYDPVRRRMIVFGGKNVQQFFNDTWQLDLNGVPTWSPLVTQGEPPSPRETRAIYDPLGDRMVISGGYGYPNHLNETWALDLSGTPTWHRLSTAQSPPPRRGQSAVYDPEGRRMLMFGGYDDVAFRNDLWALDLSGAAAPNWQPLPASGTPPPVRYGHSAVYDPDRREMMVFGGYGGQFLDDQYVLSLAGTPTWSSVDVTPRPSPRDFYALLLDPVSHRVVLFGGNEHVRRLGDLWSFDPAVPSWSLINSASSGPKPRLSAGGVFDPKGQRLILFGGWGGEYFGDTWSLALDENLPSWAPIADAGATPSPRLEHTVVYDSRRNRLLLFGGKDQYQFFNDVWQLDLNGEPVWSPLVTTGTPPSPRETRAIYDPARDRVVIFGGFSPPAHLNETWVLELDPTPTWRQLSLRGPLPAPRRGQTAVYDSKLDRMVVFGGFDDRQFFNDVWVLPLSGSDRWRPLAARGTPPSPRYGMASVYLEGRDQMVVFGGWNGQFLDDGFVLTLFGANQWSPLASTTQGPGVRDFHSLIYDVPRARLVLYGGNNQGPLDDLWEYQLGDPLAGAQDSGTPPESGVRSVSRFGLEGFVPNPLVYGRRVAFSVPDTRPARVDVFDLAGRRVASYALTAPLPGRHVVSLEGGVLSAGVYLIRLTQGERSSSVRGAVLR